jgi:ribosomal protein L21E
VQGKDVLIKHDGNFYDGMVGVIIEDYQDAKKVLIFLGDDWDEVMFYNEQLELK